MNPVRTHVMRGEIQCATKRSAQLAEGEGGEGWPWTFFNDDEGLLREIVLGWGSGGGNRLGVGVVYAVLHIHPKRISTAQLPQRLFRFAIRVVPFLLPGLSAIIPDPPPYPPVAHSLAVFRCGHWGARRRHVKK